MATTQKNALEIEKLAPVLPVPRAAEVAGVSRRTVRRWAREDRVVAYNSSNGKGGARLLIDTRSLLKMLGVEVAEE